MELLLVLTAAYSAARGSSACGSAPSRRIIVNQSWRNFIQHPSGGDGRRRLFGYNSIRETNIAPSRLSLVARHSLTPDIDAAGLNGPQNIQLTFQAFTKTLFCHLVVLTQSYTRTEYILVFQNTFKAVLRTIWRSEPWECSTTGRLLYKVSNPHSLTSH